jgi:hypothetical protein
MDESAKHDLHDSTERRWQFPSADRSISQISCAAEEFFFKNLVVIVKMLGPGLAYCCNAKYDANEDGWTSCGKHQSLGLSD